MNHPLQAQELGFAYGDRTVIDRLTLELKQGEVLILLGANGAGKTTLLRSLARQLKPQQGTVLVNDEDIRSFSHRSLATHIAFMPQHENREATLNVEDVVALGRAPHVGWWMPLSLKDHAAVDAAIEMTGLSDMRQRPITELSGGEWRRMILARALAQQAQILILDEPTAGLDLRYQVDVLNRIQAMAHHCRLTVAMTLHDLNQAAIYGDRLALLHEGQLVAVGKSRDVLTPETVKTAFGVDVAIIDHPMIDAPLVIPTQAPTTLE